MLLSYAAPPRSAVFSTSSWFVQMSLSLMSTPSSRQSGAVHMDKEKVLESNRNSGSAIFHFSARVARLRWPSDWADATAAVVAVRRAAVNFMFD
jgi:hypothetical protein